VRGFKDKETTPVPKKIAFPLKPTYLVLKYYLINILKQKSSKTASEKHCLILLLNDKFETVSRH